jgi:hypothetical protein
VATLPLLLGQLFIFGDQFCRLKSVLMRQTPAMINSPQYEGAGRLVVRGGRAEPYSDVLEYRSYRAH